MFTSLYQADWPFDCNETKTMEDPNAEICKVCGDKFLLQNLKDHRNKLKHIEAQRKKAGETECKICKEKYVKGYGNEHKETKIHRMVERQMRESKKLEARAEVRRKQKETYNLRQGSEENQQYINTLATFLALRFAFANKDFQMSINNKDWDCFGDVVFEIVNNKTDKGKKEDAKAVRMEGDEKARQNKEKEKAKAGGDGEDETATGNEEDEKAKGSKEDQKYRGDEITETEIVAIRCKKIETKNNYTAVALSAKTGHLSLREQCEILRKLRGNEDDEKARGRKADEKVGESGEDDKADDSKEDKKDRGNEVDEKAKKCKEDEKAEGSNNGDEKTSGNKDDKKARENGKNKKGKGSKKDDKATGGKKGEETRRNEDYEKANFQLHTIASVVFDPNPKIVWDKREISIKQPINHKKDLFNTTDDTDDVYIFEAKDEDLKKDLNKFRMYTNQKKKPDLEILIKTMIEDTFNTSADICDDLVKYVKQYFKTDKVLKKHDTSFKMTKEDVFLKVAELLLSPFMIHLNCTIKGQYDLDLWNSTVKEFDVVIMRTNPDIIDKIYTAMTLVVVEETHYVEEVSKKVTVTKDKVKNDRLKSRIFEDHGNDGTLRFLYVALWKSGLVPLVLKADNEGQMAMILNIITFFKKKHLGLKFIVSVNFPVVYGSLPEDLKICRSLEDVRFVSNELLDKILAKKIKVLDFELCLKDIERCNEDFLEKLTPDALLNVCFDDYAFKDSQVPMTSEIVDNTLVLDDGVIARVKNTLQRSDSERGLSYLVTVKGQSTRIQVPPHLFN